MATRYIGYATDAAGVQKQAGRFNVVGAASGGTLAGSQTLQVVFDDAEFTSSQESKQRLLDGLQSITNAIECARSWPIDSTS